MAIATDCKSVRESVRWFESTLPHIKAKFQASLFLCPYPYKLHFSKISSIFVIASNLLYIFALPIRIIMKIFVAKLAFKTTTEDLRALFEQFGTVESCKVIMDHETGRSKCYGFVEMPNDDEAYKSSVVVLKASLATKIFIMVIIGSAKIYNIFDAMTKMFEIFEKCGL